MSENLMNSANSQNDEIDIFELLGKIWKGKFSIAMITLAFFALGVLYAIIATPWYSAKARISVPYYKNLEENKKELLVEADMIINKIQSKYIDALKGQPKENVFVEKVTPAKQSGTKNNLNDFFDIEVFGKSNDEAVALINKIVKEEQEIYKNDINLKAKVIENNIENISIKINQIQNLQIKNLSERIRVINETLIPNNEKEIQNLQNVVLAQRKADYDDLVGNVIPNLQKEILDIENLLKNPNLSQNNAITLKERLADLREQYTTTTTTRRQIEYDLHNDEFVKVAELQKTRENLQTQINDLQKSIDEKKDEITKLENQKEILQASLNPQNLSNVAVKDDIIVTNNAPIKPKKLLIVAIATFLGGILGVFWVLLKSEIVARKNLKA